MGKKRKKLKKIEDERRSRWKRNGRGCNEKDRKKRLAGNGRGERRKNKKRGKKITRK